MGDNAMKRGVKMHKLLNDNKILLEQLICTTNQLTELNKLKDKLLREVTHDMRSPMATMVSMMEILNDDDGSDNREIIYEVRKHVKSTFTMVENLLERLDCQKGGLVYKDIFNATQETINVLSGNDMVKDIRIMNNMEDVVTLFLDKEILGMVLCNIVSSAVKMASSGGLISIQTHQIEQEVIATIRDTGISIGLDKAKTLFSQANIGILILKEFVQSGEIQRLMEGTGKDSTFYFCLSSKQEVNRI